MPAAQTTGSTRQQTPDGPRPVAALLLVRRRHLAEGATLAFGDEHRIVAEAVGAARRIDQLALHATFGQLRRPSGQARQSTATKAALRSARSNEPKRELSASRTRAMACRSRVPARPSVPSARPAHP